MFISGVISGAAALAKCRPDPYTWISPVHLVFHLIDWSVSFRNELSLYVDMGFGLEQRSSKRLPLGHRTPPLHPVQSAQHPSTRLLIASIIVGCVEHSYVPYLPSCHGAHRHARSCSSSIRQLAKSKRSPRVMLWTMELRERAPRLMATAWPKTRRGRRRRSGSRPLGYAGIVGVFSKGGSTP